MPIEIYCMNCGFQLAYLTKDVERWSRLLKMYKYRCPKCGHELDPSQLQIKKINFYYRKTNPKPWNLKAPLKWRPWRP